MPVRGVLRSLLSSCSAFRLLGWAAARARARPRQPNLVLVTLDTVRADHLGCYGDREAVTPWLDRLAGEGIRFANASSAVPLTLPSHTSLLTGLLPPHHGLRNNGVGALRPGTATLATLLAGAGYRTGAFVGAFVLDHRFGLKPGSRSTTTRSSAIRRPAPSSRRSGRGARWWTGRSPGWRKDDDAARSSSGSTSTTPTPPTRRRRPGRARHPGRPYDGEISAVDEQVGRLLAELDRRGLDGKHGGGGGRRSRRGPGRARRADPRPAPLRADAARAAAAARPLGGSRPRVVETPVSLVDLAPTLAGLLGQDLPAPGGRRSTAATSRAPCSPAASRRPGEVYAETRYPAIFGWSPLAALRRRDLKYISALPAGALRPARATREEPADLLATAASARAREASRPASPRSRRAPWRRAAPPAADAETRAKLASLGYVAGSSAGGAGGRPGEAAPAQRLDPKTMVDLFQRFEQANARLTRRRLRRRRGGELEALVAADPAQPVFRGKLAAAWRERGETAKALPLYRQAAAAAPPGSRGLVQPGRRAPGGRPARRGAAGDRARPAARRRPARGPQHAGDRRAGAGQAGGGAARVRDRRRLDPRNAAALNNLGNVLRARAQAGRGGERLPALRGARSALRRAAQRPRHARGGARSAAEHFLFSNAPWLSPRDTTRSGSTGPSRTISRGTPEPPGAPTEDFLAATAGDPRFAEQRRAAQQLLARLEGRTAGSAPAERR